MFQAVAVAVVAVVVAVVVVVVVEQSYRRNTNQRNLRRPCVDQIHHLPHHRVPATRGSVHAIANIIVINQKKHVALIHVKKIPQAVRDVTNHLFPIQNERNGIQHEHHRQNINHLNEKSLALHRSSDHHHLRVDDQNPDQNQLIVQHFNRQNAKRQV